MRGPAEDTEPRRLGLAISAVYTMEGLVPMAETECKPKMKRHELLQLTP
jgi:hypothetical protein